MTDQLTEPVNTGIPIDECPTPEYHDTHRDCPSCGWRDPATKAELLERQLLLAAEVDRLERVDDGPDLPALPPGMHTSMEVRTQTVKTTVFEARVTLRHRDGRQVQACGTAYTARAAQAAAIDAGLRQLGEEPADG